MSEIKPCIYNQSDCQIKRIVDLKFKYYYAESSFIKNVLEELDGLVAHRVGSIDDISRKVSEKTPESLEEEMSDAMTTAVSAQVTYAVRDTVVDDKEIKSGDILGIVEGKIKVVEKDDVTCVLSILTGLINDETEYVTMFYGCDVHEAEADRLSEIIEELYPDVEFTVAYGGQPVYSYILSVE